MSEATRATTLAEAWAEGHLTDEHGPGLCECLNPYDDTTQCVTDGTADGPMSKAEAEDMVAYIRARPPGSLTLTDFLLSRIAEDEAAVKRALDFPYHVAGPPWGAAYEPVADDPSSSLTDHHLAVTPARVLAECAARRRIVERERWTPSPGMECDGHPIPFAPHGDYGEGFCMYYAERDGEFSPDLRDLAAIYSDHPDYRADWA